MFLQQVVVNVDKFQTILRWWCFWLSKMVWNASAIRTDMTTLTGVLMTGIHCIKDTIYTSALRLLALRELLFTLYLYSGLRPSVWGKVTSDNWNLRNLRYNTTNISHMLLKISYSESTYPITPVEPLKVTLYDHFGISVHFVYFIFI